MQGDQPFADEVYRRLVETATDAVVVARAEDRTIVEANPTAEDLFGLDRGEIRGSTIDRFHPADEVDAYRRLFDHLSETGATTQDGLHVRTAGGERVPVEVSVNVLEVDGQRLVQGRFRDVSEQWELREELRTQERRYRRIFGHSNDAIFVVDPATDSILECNETACEMLGYDRSELRSMGISDIHPEEMDRFRTFAGGVFAEGHSFTDELSCLTSEGERVPAHVAASTLPYEGRTCMLACIQDISTQKRRERMLRALGTTAQDLIVARTPEESARLTVEAVDEVFDLALSSVWFHTDDGFELAAASEVSRERGLPTLTDPDQFLRPAFDRGERTTVGGLRADPDMDPSEESTADNWGQADDDRAPDGVTRCVPRVVVCPLGDHGVLGVGLPDDRDLESEEERFLDILCASATAALTQATREADLERTTEQLSILNRIVRHDIRNDMTLVLGLAEHLRAHVDSEAVDDLDVIVDQAEHVVSLTDVVGNLVAALTDEGDVDLESIALREIVETQVRKARSGFPEATFEVRGVPDVRVLATPMLSSVFENLLNNAVQHHDGETPRVWLSGERVDGGDRVRITVADDGPGIDPDRREAVFGRGEKGLESEGVGLGLYLVDRLTDQFGGDVHITESESGGTAIVVTLQVA